MSWELPVKLISGDCHRNPLTINQHWFRLIQPLPSPQWVEVCTALTHCGLVTSYGDIDLRQLWHRQWLVAWRHQAITWTNVDLSSERSSGNHLRAVSQEIPPPWISKKLENHLYEIPFKSPRGHWVNIKLPVAELTNRQGTNICRELGQYHGCWCPGSWHQCHQQPWYWLNSIHGSLPSMGKISNTYATTNDRKCRYILVFPQTHQGLKPHQQTSRVDCQL